MANKLYEENHIADIANAIRSANGKSDTYTVAEMSDAIRSVKKIYKGEIKETILGTTAYAVLAEDEFLAEHRADDTLFVRVYFDVESQPYTIKSAWSVANETDAFNMSLTNGVFQSVVRFDGNENISVGKPTCKFTDTDPAGVGSTLITTDGKLRLYSGSASNYAIRPSNYTVIVEC